MSLLLSERALEQRREAVAGPLRPLAESLAADLSVVASRDLFFPSEKALLSREGGRCARDGTYLAFDPFERGVHVCPVCGAEYRGDLHYQFWIYWYQLWLAERAVHAAVLYRLGVGDFAPLASAILDGYAERYATYPNVDNVLGPTRLFFSTYLESIWLLQICVAADLLATTHPSLAERVRDRIVEPSRAIIAEYDEGGSNRQVWNDVALLASARLLGDAAGVERAVFGSSGIAFQLSSRLLADGTWYEGENYHLFAHRGLWYGVTMAVETGLELPANLVDRFQLGFATPLATALPDFTLPARRDSQYKISLRQWRIAEHFELGLARSADPLLAGALERIYRDDISRGKTSRRASSADVERNLPASALTRADLSWRALLHALPSLPPLEPIAPKSVLLRDQGLAVFRRNEGRTYVALDYGHSGGGHGHADRLNLLLANGDTRWLDDYGTGSYVDPSLHWYRSTLAHNAPLLERKSQPPIDGTLSTFDERGDLGWVEADFRHERGIVTRTIVVTDDYLIDTFDSSLDRSLGIALPIHIDLVIVRGAGPVESARLEGSAGLEDGFRFVHDAEVQRVAAGATVEAHAVSDRGETLRVWSRSDSQSAWWRAVAPGPPGTGDRAFRLIETHDGERGLANVIAWSERVVGVEIGDTIRISLADGTTHEHRQGPSDWHIGVTDESGRRSIVLKNSREKETDRSGAPVEKSPVPMLLENGEAILELGEAHYRRSEQTWADAGRPTARVSLSRKGDGMRISVRVAESDLAFVPADAVNPYDNEHPDINGDGIQLYVNTEAGAGSWTLVPEAGSTRVRIREIGGQPSSVAIGATWNPVGKGYEVNIDLANLPTAIDLIVNEMPRGRERRRGQLVMSGARGEFVYLRGDRHERSRLMPIDASDG